MADEHRNKHRQDGQIKILLLFKEGNKLQKIKTHFSNKYYIHVIKCVNRYEVVY
jgi:hypothetical protein